MSGRKRIVLVLAVLLAAAGGGAWYATHRPQNGEDVIRLSGNIEATEVAVSFKIPGRVLERLVDEGQKARQGQVIARLEMADLRADLDFRRAELRAAQAALAELEAGSRPEEIEAARAAMEKARWLLVELEAGSRRQEIDAARSQLAAADVERNRTEADLARFKRLFSSNTISQEQYDQAKAAADVALQRYRQASQQYDLVKEGPRTQQIAQARSAFKQAESQFKLVQEGPRKEVIEQGRAKLEQAKAAVLLSETKRSYATIVSPLDGVVLSKNTEPGEYVSPGTPVVTVADIKNIWLRAYIDESDLGRVQLGQTAEVFTDAYPGRPYTGRLSFISSEAEFTPKTIQTAKERVRLVYRIKIDITNTDLSLKPGMPADAILVPATRPDGTGG